MKSKIRIAIILIALIFPLVAFSTQAKADGSGYTPQSSEGVLVDSFGFPPVGTTKIFNFCAMDNSGGLWHLTASSGTITGTRDNIADCVWNVSGTYQGPNFHMDLFLSSGTQCCTSGYTDGIVDKASRTASGDTYWTGNCNSGPWVYIWSKC